MHIFPEHRKLNRPDLKQIPVKSFQVKIIVQSIFPFFFQIKKIKTSPAILLVIGGCFYDVLKNIRCDMNICNSEKLKKTSRLCFAPAIIMNADIKK